MRLQKAAHWKLAKFCALDVETTGLDLLNDEIISIGAVQIIEGRIVQSFDFYREVKPGIAPSVESIQIHGLRAMDQLLQLRCQICFRYCRIEF
jgi:DNA polymerase III epsilon subunit-like protein